MKARFALSVLVVAILHGCSGTRESPFREGPPPPGVSAEEGASPSAASSTYTVKRGDSLWSISKQFYGSGEHYQRIVEANPGLDPGSLQVGQRISIPEN